MLLVYYDTYIVGCMVRPAPPSFPLNLTLASLAVPFNNNNYYYSPYSYDCYYIDDTTTTTTPK